MRAASRVWRAQGRGACAGGYKQRCVRARVRLLWQRECAFSITFDSERAIGSCATLATLNADRTVVAQRVAAVTSFGRLCNMSDKLRNRLFSRAALRAARNGH